LPKRSVFKVLHLEPTRYYSWKRHSDCGLDDQKSCPHTSPTQLTKDEMQAVKAMVISKQYRHMPIRTLCYHAQRIGKVIASPGVWYKLIRLHQWKRPRMRLYPKKATIGIRATKQNEIWHIDTTIIRLLNGTKAYLHAVIDNYSRKILSWTVADHMDIESTCTVLLEAAKFLESKDSKTPTLICDSGIENVNGKIDELILSGLFMRILAQVEVAFSNSMIEAFWKYSSHYPPVVCG
jgi:putative transposase